MAFERHRTAFPGIALATVLPRTAVRFAPTGVQDRAVVPVTDSTQPVLGVTGDAPANPGQSCRAHDHGNTVKMVAGASIGHGAEVGVASANGAVGPIAGASGVVRHSIGQSCTVAAPGEVFSVYVNPRQLSGAA